MKLENCLLNSENLSLKTDIQICNVVCLFLDIRNSTQINDKYDSKKLFKIYSYILNNSYEHLKKHGFKNVEIQGDGIYGLFPFEKNEIDKISTIVNAIKEITDVIEKAYNDFQIKSAISIRYGKEWYSAFGEKSNKNKTLSFFGNVVSKTKKMNSLARNGKIIISKSKFDEAYEKLKSELKSKLKIEGNDLYLQNGKEIGLTFLVKWNNL